MLLGIQAIPKILNLFSRSSLSLFPHPLSSIFMSSIVKSSFAFRARLLSSSLQLLINYSELKQLELQRCTINKHPLHDATRRPHNHKTAKQISSFLISCSFSFIFSSCSPLPQDAFHKYTQTGLVGAGFPVH